MIELMYQAQLEPRWMMPRPGLQYIGKRAAASSIPMGRRKNALVLGVRSLLSF
jgi:hypothetical protein